MPELAVQPRLASLCSQSHRRLYSEPGPVWTHLVGLEHELGRELTCHQPPLMLALLGVKVSATLRSCPSCRNCRSQAVAATAFASSSIVYTSNSTCLSDLNIASLRVESCVLEQVRARPRAQALSLPWDRIQCLQFQCFGRTTSKCLPPSQVYRLFMLFCFVE